MGSQEVGSGLTIQVSVGRVGVVVQNISHGVDLIVINSNPAVLQFFRRWKVIDRWQFAHDRVKMLSGDHSL